jgi:FemAB-related protein (PEP-CTERM system-associated)
MRGSAVTKTARAAGPEPATGAEVVIAEDASPEEWDGFVERHADGTGDHLWHWRDVFADVFGQQCVYLAARAQGEIVGVLPMALFRSRLFGRFAVSLPYLNYGGVLASSPDVADALVRHAAQITRTFGGSHLELRHRARQCPSLPSRDHKVALTMALPATADALWTSVDRKARNQVRKAQKEGLTSQTGGLELVDEFYPVFAENMRDLGTPVYSRRLFAETLRRFPKHVQVAIVRHQGKTIAGAFTFTFRDTALVPWASSLRSHRHLCPNMLLYWSMMEGAIASGARRFDFGRSSRGAGTHHFKTQWGADEAPLNWEYVLLTRESAPDQGPGNSRFNLAIETWRRLPLWLSNRIGPAIVRNIP